MLGVRFINPAHIIYCVFAQRLDSPTSTYIHISRSSSFWTYGYVSE